MPKRATATKKATVTVEECRKIAAGAKDWNDLRSKLKGKGCAQTMMSKVWNETKVGKGKDRASSAAKGVVVVLVGSQGGNRCSALKMPGAPKRTPKKVRISISPRSAPAPKKAIAKRGCVQQTTKKYASRNSPAFPANQCCHAVKQGQNEHADRMYRSVPDKNGVCKWMLE